MVAVMMIRNRMTVLIKLYRHLILIKTYRHLILIKILEVRWPNKYYRFEQAYAFAMGDTKFWTRLLAGRVRLLRIRVRLLRIRLVLHVGRMSWPAWSENKFENPNILGTIAQLSSWNHSPTYCWTFLLDWILIFMDSHGLLAFDLAAAI